VHHKLEELLDQYLKASGLEKEPESPLFPASIGKTGKLSRRPLVRTDAADMLKRRLKQAGLPAHYSPHSFRATGITNFLENDGTLEAAQRIAGHADSRTTKLYDRRGQKACSRIWKGFDIDPVHGRRQAFLTTDIQALVLGIGKECSCRKMAAGSWVYPVFGIDPFSESTTFRRNYCKKKVGFKPLKLAAQTRANFGSRIIAES